MVGYQGSQEPEQWVGTRNQCVVQRGATGAPLGDHWPIYLVDIFSRAQRVTHGLTSAARPGGGAPGAELSSALRQHKIESIHDVIIANDTIVLWFVKTGKQLVEKVKEQIENRQKHQKCATTLNSAKVSVARTMLQTLLSLHTRR